MGMTMAEKILARTSGNESIKAGQYLTAVVDRMMLHEGFILSAMTLQKMGVKALHDPDRVVVMFDHYFPAPNIKMADGHMFGRSAVKTYDIKNFLGHPGVCHQVMCEQGFVLPGQLILGTDSHSTTYGALGAAGTGIGTTEMAYAMAIGELWFQVPHSIKIELSGEPEPGISAKDIILYIAGKYGTDFAQYRSIEFVGPVVEKMSISGRMNIANMGIEVGAKFTFFPADQTTMDYLDGKTEEDVAPFGPDEDAAYERTIKVDLTGMTPQVAFPHSPGNVKPIGEIGDVEVNQAYLGSCTNGRLEDLAVAARMLEGRTVSANTRLLVVPASREVQMAALQAGYIETLLAAGAHLVTPGCGACLGGHQGLIGSGENCISSTNRNFTGRMGSEKGLVYLGSPATVAASAITGKITDPREFWNETSI
jgi:3-isopropylmalate/(R)-2-methylmalate dehydratase large subunit